MKKLFRGVAQMVARMVRDHEAASSSLATPTRERQTAFAVCLFFRLIYSPAPVMVTFFNIVKAGMR